MGNELVKYYIVHVETFLYFHKLSNFNNRRSRWTNYIASFFLDLDINLNKYLFMTIDDNSNKFKFPKPVCVPIKNDLESRPKNVTDYEKGHKDVCKNSWQADYTKLHQRLLETNQNKFILYECTRGGWGHRVSRIVYHFHFAVITKRAFILKCNTPSPLHRFLQTRNINWNYKVNETGLTVRRGYKVILNDSDPKTFDPIPNYNVEYNPEFDGTAANYWADHLKYDLPAWPNYKQMMGCSFYYLFRKSDMLQNSLDHWKETLGFNKNIVIGIHIRQGDFLFPHKAEWDKRITEMKHIDFSFDCAGQIQMKVEEKYNTTNVIWFLAADTQKMKDYARQKHGDKVTYISGPIEHIGFPRKGNEDAVHLSMFLDFFLLQETDYRLYLVPSSFDHALDYITLGAQTVGTSRNVKGRYGCTIPNSLKG